LCGEQPAYSPHYMRSRGVRMMNKVLYELDALISEISDPVQLQTLDRIGAEIKRLQKIISVLHSSYEELFIEDG